MPDEAAQIRERDLAWPPVPVVPSEFFLSTIYRTLHAHRAKRLGAMERLGLLSLSQTWARKGHVAWSTGTLALCWDDELVKKRTLFFLGGCWFVLPQLKLNGAKRAATGVTIHVSVNGVNSVKQVCIAEA